jgi:hypothetical protein
VLVQNHVRRGLFGRIADNRRVIRATRRVRRPGVAVVKVGR